MNFNASNGRCFISFSLETCYETRSVERSYSITTFPCKKIAESLMSFFNALVYLFLRTVVLVFSVTYFCYDLTLFLMSRKVRKQFQSIDRSTVLSPFFREKVWNQSFHFSAHRSSGDAQGRILLLIKKRHIGPTYRIARI